VLALTALEVILQPDVPLYQNLVESATHARFVTSYGLPIVHPFLLTLSSFLSVLVVQRMWKLGRSWNRIAHLVILQLPALMFLSRGTLATTALACLFLTLPYIGRLRLRSALSLAAVGLAGILLFGALGNLRSGGSAYILQISEPSPALRTVLGPLTDEVMWSYIYFSSPIATFANTTRELAPLTSQHVDDSVRRFFITEVVPDVLSDRLAPGIDRPALAQLHPALTVGTVFGPSFAYLGWMGPLLMVCLVLIFNAWVSALIPNKDPYGAVVLAFAHATMLLLVFSNMLTYTGLLAPIGYGLLAGWLRRVRFFPQLKGR